MVVSKSDMLVSNKAQRVLIWVSLVMYGFFGLGLVVFMRFFPPPPPTLSVSEVVAVYTRNLPMFQTGVVMCLIGSAVLLPWSLVIYAQMTRLERGFPILSILQLLAGALGTVFMWAPPMLWGYAAFTVTRDPEIAMGAHQFGWLMMVVPVVVWPMQLLPIGVIALTKNEDDRYSAFPRWLGYATILFAIEPLVELGAIVFKTGPVAWNGLLSWWIPMFMWFPWMLSVTFSILKSIKHQEALLEDPRSGQTPVLLGTTLGGKSIQVGN